ncbi:hypothetical protein AVO51_17470 [Vibrio cholerae]|nr:hypothetical protein AVO51_17470 [Vibrio cholerae]
MKYLYSILLLMIGNLNSLYAREEHSQFEIMELRGVQVGSYHLNNSNEFETWWTVCGGALHIISCSLSGWGTIEIELSGAIGALASTGYTKINRKFIENNYTNNIKYDSYSINGSVVSVAVYSYISGYDVNTQEAIFDIHIGGAAGIGGGKINKITFMY